MSFEKDNVPSISESTRIARAYLENPRRLKLQGSFYNRLARHCDTEGNKATEIIKKTTSNKS